MVRTMYERKQEEFAAVILKVRKCYLFSFQRLLYMMQYQII